MDLKELAKLLGIEATEALQDNATVKKEDTQLRNGYPSLAQAGGAPLKVHKPRWILTVARDLDPGPQRLLDTLLTLAKRVATTRGYARRIGTLTLHLPVDLLAAHLGVHRATIWRWTNQLKALGLIDTRTHYGTLRGRTVATGVVWAIRLRPGRARITHEDLRHPYRNLEEDRRRGATAWAWRKLRPSLDILVQWALGFRRGPAGPGLSPGAMPDLYAIAYLPEASKSDLPHLITDLATYLANQLRDPGGRRYYAGLLWQVAKGEIDPWRLIPLIQRTLTDLAEGWARKAGALLASRTLALAKAHFRAE